MGDVGVFHAGATGTKSSDGELVAAVRVGDDAAFEQLYKRYQRRIRGFVARRVGAARAEDLTQEVFLSALRHMRSSDARIQFKPWLFEIARNATIDAHRRASRAEELPVHDAERLRPLDRVRLAEAPAPEVELAAKERLDHLSGAFDELPQHHSRALVMRELEGLSYDEIGERMELTRPAVESTLFRARRKLAYEYDELVAGRRCESARTAIGMIAEGVDVGAEQRRLARHARRCSACRRRARELGVEPLPRVAALRRRVAALLPLPWLLGRRSGRDGSPLSAGGEGAGGQAGAMLLGPGAQVSAALAERAAAIMAAAVIAGAGGAALAVGQSGTPSAEGSHNQAVLGALSPGGAPSGTVNPLPRPPARITGGKPRGERGSRGKAKSRSGKAKRRGAKFRDFVAPGASPGAGAGASRPQAAAGGPSLPGLPRLGAAPGRPAVPTRGTTNGLPIPGVTMPEDAPAVAPELPDLPATGAGDLLDKLP